MKLFNGFKRRSKGCMIVLRSIKDNGDIYNSTPINLLPGDTMNITYSFTTQHEGATITAVKTVQLERIN